MTAEVDIVIVNWNSGQLLRECVASLARASGAAAARVIIVDNGSSDGSAAVTAPGLRLEVIEAGRNLGFGRACNVGAARAQADYLLFLNPDARIGEDALAQALAFMERGESAGVGICGIRLVDDAGTVQRHCARFPTARSYFGHATGLSRLVPGLLPPRTMLDFDHLSSRRVDHVIGAFFLVRRAVFESLGGFDERFFLYLEDLDFSLRAAEAGWTTHYLAEACGYHKGGGVSEQVQAARLFFSARSQIVYGFKHFSGAGALVMLIATALIEPVMRTLAAALRGRGREIAQIGLAYRMLAADVGNIRRTIATLPGGARPPAPRR